MGRIVLTSAVYLGDVAPFLAVARRLHERGHDVTVVAPEGFRSVVAPEPFGFHPYALDCSPASMHDDPEHTRLMRHPFRHSMALGRYWMDRAFTSDVDAAAESLRSAFAGADVVVTHPTFGCASIPVARSLGIPVVVGQLFPMMIPTGRWTPPLGARSPSLGRPVNRAVWRALRAVSGRVMGDDRINPLRERCGLPPIRGNAGFSWLEADRIVVLASPHYYLDEPPDWPPVRWGGFAVWEGPPAGPLPADLVHHLTHGDPPVLVTLGTSAASGAGDTFRRIVDDLDDRGLRSVVLHGGTVDVGELAQRPGVVPFAPMTEVLPHCGVAVVSGAMGGLAAALRAGVPVVVHPQLFDQVWNARRIEQLGVGLAARRPGQVAAAARRIADDPTFRDRARALAALMAAEDGAAVLADEVEALLA